MHFPADVRKALMHLASQLGHVDAQLRRLLDEPPLESILAMCHHSLR